MKKRIIILVATDLLILAVFLIFVFGTGVQFETLFEIYPVLMVIIFMVFFGLPTLVFMLPMMEQRKRRQQLLATGTAAKATVLAIADTGITSNDRPVVKLKLKVIPEFGYEFEIDLETSVPRVAIPRVGDVLDVRYDPNDTSKIAVVF